MEGWRRRGRKKDVKKKMRYVHLPTPHDECDHNVLQTCTNKNKKQKSKL